MLPSDQDRLSRESRVRRLTWLVLVGFGAVGFRLFDLQILKHDQLAKDSVGNHLRRVVLRAPRGLIYDRRGVLLVDSKASPNVVFRPFPAESANRAHPARNPEWIAALARRVELDTADVMRLVSEANQTGQATVLRRHVPFAVGAAVQEWGDELPGVEVQEVPLRRYHYGALAAHLLGYAGQANDKDIKDGYSRGDLVGRSGVERSYEDSLRGVNGAEFEVVNASGRRVATVEGNDEVKPRPGSDLVLALDLEVQMALEEVMADVRRGAAVAMDPRDGGILGMVSRPAFDPNDFSWGLTREQWRELSSGGSNPLLNRAIQGLYPPGSTFKVVTMLAALRSEVAGSGTRLQPCGGHYVFGGRPFRCWKPAGHGSLDFPGALQHSCDVYFYQIGLRLGLPRLEEAARALGLGEATGIDLPQEQDGLVPSPEWYDRRRITGAWRKAVMLNLAIGQGELQLTPLQIATMLSEVVMEGRPIRPHVVQEVRGDGPSRPPGPTRPPTIASTETWEAIRLGLEKVVSEGTGTAARVPGVRVGGKTGTAQNPHGEDHALFVCYAPVEDPRIVLAFVIENSGHGGSVAAPRAGKVLRRVFLPDSLRRQPMERGAPIARAGFRNDD